MEFTSYFSRVLGIISLVRYELWVFQEVDGKIHGKLNASWKISSLAVNGQSFLVIDGYLLHFTKNWLSDGLVSRSLTFGTSMWLEICSPVKRHVVDCRVTNYWKEMIDDLLTSHSWSWRAKERSTVYWFLVYWPFHRECTTDKRNALGNEKRIENRLLETNLNR